MQIVSWLITRAIRKKMPKLRRTMTSSFIRIARRHSKMLATLRRRSVVLLLIGIGSFGVESSAEWKPSEVETFHYPAVARFAGIEGIVVLSFTIDEGGTISPASVVSGILFLVRRQLRRSKPGNSVWAEVLRDHGFS